MTTTIRAWVYDPTNALFGKKSQKAARYTVTCENPQGCDLYVNEKSCILTGACTSCKFGKKTCKQGPTQRARGFRDWIVKEQARCREISHDLRPFKARNRIFRANGAYYLPYTGMSDAFLLDGAPLKSEWVAEEDMTPENLERLCRAVPRNVFQEPIRSYQREEVPKFLADLKMFYPEIFARLPEDQQARVETIDYVGRKADITTIAPGKVTLGKDVWDWDGTTLIRKGRATFQPVPGDCVTTIVPREGAEVKITRNDQVTPETVFLD